MEKTKPSVSKLLRVLVAGGVALAGTAGVAQAEDAQDKTGKPTTEKADPAKKPADPAASKKKAASTDKEKKEKEKGAEEGGGVKGW